MIVKTDNNVLFALWSKYLLLSLKNGKMEKNNTVSNSDLFKPTTFLPVQVYQVLRYITYITTTRICCRSHLEWWMGLIAEISNSVPAVAGLQRFTR